MQENDVVSVKPYPSKIGTLNLFSNFSCIDWVKIWPPQSMPSKELSFLTSEILSKI